MLTRGAPWTLLNIAMSLGLQAWDRAGTPWIIGSALGMNWAGEVRTRREESSGCQEGKGPSVVHSGDGILKI